MARMDVYVRDQIKDKIRARVDLLRAEGATKAEANMSSVATDMLTVGLRVTENWEKKNKQGQSNEGQEEDMVDVQVRMMEEILKARVISQKILQLLFCFPDVKNSANNHDAIVENHKLIVNSLLSEVFKPANDD